MCNGNIDEPWCSSWQSWVSEHSSSAFSCSIKSGQIIRARLLPGNPFLSGSLHLTITYITSEQHVTPPSHILLPSGPFCVLVQKVPLWVKCFIAFMRRKTHLSWDFPLNSSNLVNYNVYSTPIILQSSYFIKTYSFKGKDTWRICPCTFQTSTLENHLLQ